MVFVREWTGGNLKRRGNFCVSRHWDVMLSNKGGDRLDLKWRGIFEFVFVCVYVCVCVCLCA